MKTESIDYSHGNTKLKAFVAYDDSVTGKRPAIFMVHAREGLTDFRRYASLALRHAGSRWLHAHRRRRKGSDAARSRRRGRARPISPCPASRHWRWASSFTFA